ncbi:MAG: DASS family sodium-coupled anion symporter [Methanoregula sp.]|nr:MAG: DASS family sodium-coupled anion symporter [Methanoregula sp.]
MRQVPCIIAGIILFCSITLLPVEMYGIPSPVKYTTAIAALMVLWWITEPVPLAATALLPLVLFPLFGILTIKDAAASYGDQIIFLFLGGFIIAAAMQRWGLHRRIALKIIRTSGTSPKRLVLGFMAATAFLSMWISNTASAMMMIPMAVAILAALTGEEGGQPVPDGVRKFRVCLVLGVAYAATIGGIGTIIGTPANGIFVAQAETLFPGSLPVDFFTWLKFGFPFAAIFLLIAWFWLTGIAFRGMPETIPGIQQIIGQEIGGLGALNRGERWTLLVFAATALAWIFENTKVIGGVTIPGLDIIVPGISDSMIAIAGAILLFLLPVDREKGIFTMNWETAVKVPWGILLIFGGGLCLSSAFVKSGFAHMLVSSLSFLSAFPHVVVVALIGVGLLLFGELISNTANAAIMVPLMAVLGAGIGINPLMLMLLSSLVATLGFMLPVATPPNAIAYGTGHVTVREMVRSGLVLNLIGLFLILLSTITLIPWAMGISF